MTFSDAPILTLSDGSPLAYPVLGLYVQLEPPVPEDEDRYAAATAMVQDWIGANLRWTFTTTFATPMPYRPTDMDFVVDHARASALPPLDPKDEASTMLRRHHVMTRLEFSMGCHGGKEDDDGSPFGFAFHSEVPDPKTSLSGKLPTVLMVTVPTSWDLADFRARVIALVNVLRVRWASAGLSYAGSIDQFYDEVHEAIYRHARRHPGFDVPVFVEQGNAFVDRIRSVNWLTFVGPALAARLPEAGQPRYVRRESLPGALLLQAGDQPQAGDSNRLSMPEEYREADAIVRPIRARGDLNFLFPWTEKTTTDWLRRFERRLSSGALS